jgi:DNA helicase-2/ATP-dependent DNA helicase PcrA
VNVPHHNIGTLHSHAYRVLGSPPIAEVGALRKQWNEQSGLPESWMIGNTHGENDLEDGFLPLGTNGQRSEMYNVARARMLPPEHPLCIESKEFAARWEHFKADTESIDFTDMIALAMRDVDTAPSMPRILIADEAQDFVPLQWALIRKWAAHESVDRFIVAGDPAQVLYSFAGARPDDFLIELPDDHQRVLSHSYRLPSVVHTFAEHLLQLHSHDLLHKRIYTPRTDGGEVRRLKLRGMSDTWRAPDGVIHEAQEMIEQGKTVMILASCNYMLQPVVSMLRTKGIPFHNEYRKNAGHWNPLGTAGEGRVRTVDRVLAFLRPDVKTWGEDAELYTPQEAQSWAEMLNANVFTAHGTKAAIKRSATAFPVDDEELTAPMYWLDWLATEAGGAMERLSDLDLTWLAQNVAKPYRRTVQYCAEIRQINGGAALRNPPRVTVGTIHSVKGGEADVVYLFPDLSRAAWQQMRNSQEGMDSAVRVGYVGATRAREQLVIGSAVRLGMSSMSLPGFD